VLITGPPWVGFLLSRRLIGTAVDLLLIRCCRHSPRGPSLQFGNLCSRLGRKGLPEPAEAFVGVTSAQVATGVTCRNAVWPGLRYR
jgi:hypothetical protein